ncbi:MAG: o-succinylbenzoate synthase [Acidimicrobiales bacterium]
MRLIEIELRRLELSLANPVVTAAERHARRPLLLVRATTDLGIGNGECEALESTTYAGESVDTVEEVLATKILPKLLTDDVEFESVEELIADLSTSIAAPMAIAALEMALLDAALRESGRPLASYLEVSRVAIPAGATVGIAPVRDVVHGVSEALAAGIRRVKLKIAPDLDVVPVRAVREDFPDVDLVVDANESYSLTDPSHRISLRALDELELAAIEQPLERGEISGHAQLVRELRTPILLDESIGNLEDLDRVLDAGACSGVCVKPARLGGIFASVVARDRCVAAAVPCAIGGLFEAGLGRTASIVVGALNGFDLGGDLGPSERYFEQDITLPHVLVQGMLPVPTRPGIGVDLREEVVESLTARSQRFVSS